MLSVRIACGGMTPCESLIKPYVVFLQLRYHMSLVLLWDVCESVNRSWGRNSVTKGGALSTLTNEMIFYDTSLQKLLVDWCVMVAG